MPTFPLFGRDAAARWIVVAAVWITLAIAFGLYFSFSVFFVALLDEFGWRRSCFRASASASSTAS